jgi:hypothetical protein
MEFKADGRHLGTILPTPADRVVRPVPHRINTEMSHARDNE